MKRILLAGAFVLLAGAAIADSYQDFNAGLAAKNRDDDVLAVTYLTSALAAPDLPDALRTTAYVARGAIYARNSRLDAANADFTAAIKLHPDDIAALRARAIVEGNQGRNADAMADFKQVIALQPDNYLLYPELFNAYIRSRDFGSAIAIYSDFAKKRPKDPAPVEGRAWMELGAEQFDTAITDATAAAAIYDKWVDPYSLMSTAYVDKGDFKSALKAADSGIDRGADVAVLYLQRGYADWFLGDTSGAARAFSESLDKDAHQSYAFVWLSLAMTRQNKPVPPDVAAQFSGATEAKWPGPLVLLSLGRMQPDAVLKLTGNDPDTLGSKECTTRLFVGEWYAAQGKPVDAKPLLQAAAGDLCKSAPMYARFAATEVARLPGASP